ncbi:hypothetical protein M5K25_010337 [Dendrobium thyrsiflorum]|uniref:Uncharacterized protein n=1 Tax=Dendrobium thyrsiflorum TaxID=117978 RepID=A0ABD0V066_DENTH
MVVIEHSPSKAILHHTIEGWDCFGWRFRDRNASLLFSCIGTEQIGRPLHILAITMVKNQWMDCLPDGRKSFFWPAVKWPVCQYHKLMQPQTAILFVSFVLDQDDFTKSYLNPKDFNDWEVSGNSRNVPPHYIRVGLLRDASLLFSCNGTEQLGRPLHIVGQPLRLGIDIAMVPEQLGWPAHLRATAASVRHRKRRERRLKRNLIVLNCSLLFSSLSLAPSSLECPCICRQQLRLRAMVKNKRMYYLRDGGNFFWPAVKWPVCLYHKMMQPQTAMLFRLHICTSRFFGSFDAVRLGSFDDFPFLSDWKLRHFYPKQRRELAGCEVKLSGSELRTQRHRAQMSPDQGPEALSEGSNHNSDYQTIPKLDNLIVKSSGLMREI